MKSPILKFGKHKGKKISEVPFSYFAWLLTKYTGTSLTRKDLEIEAINRGCKKIDGVWKYSKKLKLKAGFDVYGNGYGFYSGITEHYNEDASCYDDAYTYSGIPNFD